MRGSRTAAYTWEMKAYSPGSRPRAPRLPRTWTRFTLCFAARSGLERVVHHEDEWFLLDVLRRVATEKQA